MLKYNNINILQHKLFTHINNNVNLGRINTIKVNDLIGDDAKHY